MRNMPLSMICTHWIQQVPDLAPLNYRSMVYVGMIGCIPGPKI